MGDRYDELLRALPVLQHPAPVFDPGGAPDDPQELFVVWLRHAIERQVVEPHAMTLSTVDAEGAPDARVLILKDLRDGAWWFATDTASAKAAQLAARPQAALTFYWPTLGRQIRLRGTVRPGDAEANAADFAARSAEAQAMVLAAGSGWVTYGLRPHAVEFWQADPARLHQRLVYTRQGGGWAHNAPRPLSPSRAP